LTKLHRNFCLVTRNSCLVFRICLQPLPKPNMDCCRRPRPESPPIVVHEHPETDETVDQEALNLTPYDPYTEGPYAIKPVIGNTCTVLHSLSSSRSFHTIDIYVNILCLWFILVLILLLAYCCICIVSIYTKGLNNATFKK